MRQRQGAAPCARASAVLSGHIYTPRHSPFSSPASAVGLPLSSAGAAAAPAAATGARRSTCVLAAPAGWSPRTGRRLPPRPDGSERGRAGQGRKGKRGRKGQGGPRQRVAAVDSIHSFTTEHSFGGSGAHCEYLLLQPTRHARRTVGGLQPGGGRQRAVTTSCVWTILLGPL